MEEYKYLQIFKSSMQSYLNLIQNSKKQIDFQSHVIPSNSFPEYLKYSF